MRVYHTKPQPPDGSQCSHLRLTLHTDGLKVLLLQIFVCRSQRRGYSTSQLVFQQMTELNLKNPVIPRSTTQSLIEVLFTLNFMLLFVFQAHLKAPELAVV